MVAVLIENCQKLKSNEPRKEYDSVKMSSPEQVSLDEEWTDRQSLMHVIIKFYNVYNITINKH